MLRSLPGVSWSIHRLFWQNGWRGVSTITSCRPSHHSRENRRCGIPWKPATSVTSIQVVENSENHINELFTKLTLKEQSLNILTGHAQRPHEYILPTTRSSALWKKTILDPLLINTSYDLPTGFSIVTEKVTPSLHHLVPIEDPDPLQGVVDGRLPPIKKEAMPWLMTLRKRKMKKHKLRKLRKKMLFVNRNLRLIKFKKREKEMQMIEKRYLDWGKEFDAEKFVDEQLKLAKSGGYEIDILADRHKAKLKSEAKASGSPSK